MHADLATTSGGASRAALIAALLCLGAAAVRAQSPDILGPSNAPFLEGLWRAGYIDYAQRVGQAVEASSLPDSEKKAVDAVHTRLKIAIAARSGDAMQRRDLVLKVVLEKSKQLEDAPLASEAAIELVGELVDQYRVLADAFVEAIAQEQEPTKVASLRKDADERFKAAEEAMEARKTAAEKLRDDKVPGSELPLLVNFYGVGRLHYYHALIHPADSLAAKRAVEMALSTLEEFDLEFSDSLAAFEAKTIQALCQQRMGDLKRALACCDEAILLRERFEAGKDGVFKVDKDAADVISAAVLQKALFLEEQKEFGKVVELARDYLATIPEPLVATQGPAVLASMAKAHVELGESEAATKEAQQLIELDPKGRWGARGQELLAQMIAGGSGKGVDAGKTLRIAESLAGQGDYDQALRMCREVQLRATAEGEQAFAAEAMLITGAVMATRGWFHEASVAFDAVVRRFPKSEHAPDALWRSIQCFSELEDVEHRPMWKRLIDERSKQLVSDYPDDPRVGNLQLLEGQRLDRSQKFLEAAAVYERIAADSNVYLDARYYAANCYQRQARSLASGGQDKEAVPFAAKAQEGFQFVLGEVDTRKLAATDAKVVAKLAQVEFGARVALANLLLTGQPKPAEAELVLAKFKIGDEDPRAPTVWALQIRARLVQGAVEEAAAAMEAALAKAGDVRPLLTTCRALAVALDNLGVEQGKATGRMAAAAQWQKATTFYMKSAIGAAPADVVQIAERLRIIGMMVNDIGEKVDGWFETAEVNVQSTGAWDGALQLYGRLAEDDAMTWKARIGLARILGFRHRWKECESELAKLFATEKIIATKGRLDSKALARKPELLTAYLEWGFALRLTTGAEEKAKRAHASDVFDSVVLSVPADSKHWWHARYGQIQTLFDRGLYDLAEVSLNMLERTNPDFDGERFGVKQKLKPLKTAISQKLPRRK